jgi:uncharacterized membrane protein YsdA (DUF1294 family)
VRGLLELVIVFTFVLGWAVIELVAMSLDKRRAERQRAEQAADEKESQKPAD